MWTPLLVHSDYSLMNSAMDCEKIAKTCKELGYTTCAITDNGSVSGFMEFADACKSSGIKPIYGIEAFVCKYPSKEREDNRDLTRIGILSKTLAGVKALFKASSQANENIDGRPRLSLEEWASFQKDWIVFSGYPGSDLYRLNTDQEITERIDYYKSLFSNFYVAINPFGNTNINTKLRSSAKKLSVKCIAVTSSHYPTRDDAADHRVLLCSALKTTLPKVQGNLHTNEAQDLDMDLFFASDNYHIPDKNEITELFWENPEELANCQEIAALCENFSLANNPILPEFQKGLDAYEEIVKLAREGWKNLIPYKAGTEKHKEYGDRIKMELSVIKENGLSNYFLIVADICRWAKENNILTGIGRGSAAGCLISYLIGITHADPIKYGLLFSRFYNSSRKNTLPDIDLDFPPDKREDVIQYIINKYGEKCVAKIATFGRLQGRTILKEVLRIHDACDFKTMNEITKFIPDESKISDDLQELREEDEENAKILYWALINNAKQLAPWVKLEKDGSYSGEFGKFFAQAIRLEGLYKQVGEHASGVIVTPTDVSDYCPVIHSKKKMLAGMPYPMLEKMGITKIDILGVSVYQKLSMILNCLEFGDCYVANCDQKNQQDNRNGNFSTDGELGDKPILV